MISWLCSLPVVQDTFTFYPSLIFDHAIVFFVTFNIYIFMLLKLFYNVSLIKYNF